MKRQKRDGATKRNGWTSAQPTPQRDDVTMLSTSMATLTLNDALLLGDMDPIVNTDQYFYIVHLERFISTNEPIYKIGKSAQKDCRRWNNYPKGTMAKLLLSVPDCDKFERDMIDIFRAKYPILLEHGAEYFKGNLRDMLTTVMQYYLTHQDCIITNTVIQRQRYILDEDAMHITSNDAIVWRPDDYFMIRRALFNKIISNDNINDLTDNSRIMRSLIADKLKLSVPHLSAMLPAYEVVNDGIMNIAEYAFFNLLQCQLLINDKYCAFAISSNDDHRGNVESASKRYHIPTSSDEINIIIYAEEKYQQFPLVKFNKRWFLAKHMSHILPRYYNINDDTRQLYLLNEHYKLITDNIFDVGVIRFPYPDIGKVRRVALIDKPTTRKYINQLNELIQEHRLRICNDKDTIANLCAYID